MTDAELSLLPRVELVLRGEGEGEVVLSLEPQDYLHDEVRGFVGGCASCVSWFRG
jgi:hypothetical protein